MDTACTARERTAQGRGPGKIVMHPPQHVSRLARMNFWDQNYSASGYKYGTRPNAFLVWQAPRIAPASDVLVPGDGEGRNGVWLAQQGHRVTAVDSSRVGLDKARALAIERGVAPQFVQADLANWMPASAAYDAVVLTYVHLPPAIRATVHRRLAQALRPGGMLILEAFHPAQLGLDSGGPKDEALLYTPELLHADFGDLIEPVLVWQGGVALDEGPGHQGEAHVTRWVGHRRVAGHGTIAA